MRVALLSAEYPPRPGGVGDYTRRLGQALMRRGHDITVLTGAAIEQPHAKGSEEPPILALHLSSWNWRCWRSVSAALDRLRPDVLHIQYQTGAYGMRPAINLLPWRLRHLPARPAIVVTAHDLLLPYLFPKAGPLRRWVTRRLLADSNAVVLTNEEDFAQVVQDWGLGIRDWGLGIRDWGLGVGRITPVPRPHSPAPTPQSPVLIPIGSNIPVTPPEEYDRQVWRARLGVEAGEALIAYFGLVSHSKGLDILIGALAQLPQRFRLLVIGGEATAPEDRVYAMEIRRQIDDYGLERRVIFTGHCAAAEVSAHLLAADLAALPFADGASFRRGSLLAILAHGVPTVTTYPTDHRPPTTDHQLKIEDRRSRMDDPRSSILDPRSSFVLRPIEDGVNVLLAPPGDAAALAEAIRRLAADAVLRERLQAGGRELAAQFSWEGIAERHEALYRQIARQ